MKYGFERTLYYPGTRAAAVKTISVTKIGRISLPKYFVQTHDIKQGVRAQLYWDEDDRALAIGFIASDDRTTFPVILPAYGGAYIDAGKLFRANGVRPEEYAHRYSYERHRATDVGINDAITDVFVIELKRRHSES